MTFKRICSYLKPYILSLIAIVGLVLVQVESELALPDSMADIITNGIQFSGITDQLPTKMSKDTYELMEVLIPDNEIDNFKQAYQEKDNVYLLEDKIEHVDEFQKAFLVARAFENPEMLKSMNLESNQQVIGMLSNPQAKEKMLSQIDEKMKDLSNDNMEAATRFALKQEYEACGIDVADLQKSYIIKSGFKMLGITAISALAAILVSLLAAKVAAGAAAKIRQDVFEKVENFELEEFSKFSTSSLITRTTNDVQQVQMVLSTLLRIGLFSPFLGIAALFKVITYESMTFILGWALVIIGVVLFFTFRYALPRFKKIQQLVDSLNLVSREQLTGMMVIRAFHNEEFEEERFDDVNQEITDINIAVNRAIALVSPFMQFLMSFVGILIIYFGAHEIDAGTLNIGSMMAFLQYAMNVLMAFLVIAMIFTMIPRSSISARRIFEVLDTPSTIENKDTTKKLPEGNQTIRFDHVSFAYPNAEQDVLHDINFEAKPGSQIAIIGSTGCGKSTLVNLIPRFFDASSGTISFGDTNIKDVDLEELRKRISYIPQNGVLFSGTIESNLKYANPSASEEQMLNALEISQSSEFVNQLEDGIESEIAQGGSNVSGGQRQRLSIARALSRNSDIYIFDDTFSALDFKTDAALRKELNEMMKDTNATIFIVAQRISTIQHADLILVLDDGQIVGQGTHEELLENCSVYQEIAFSQLSRKELSK